MDMQNATGPGTPGDARHLADQRADLLRFAAGSRHDLGFGYLDESGGLDPAGSRSSCGSRAG